MSQILFGRNPSFSPCRPFLDPKEWAKMEFQVVMIPRGQSRARDAVVYNRQGEPVKRGDGRVLTRHYKSKTQEKDETKLTALIYEHRPARPLKGMIYLGMRVYSAIPGTVPDAFKVMAPEKGKYAWFVEGAKFGDLRPTGRPDLDNVFKNFKDTASGIFWLDDKQVVGYVDDSGKYYGDPPRYEITIWYRRDMQI